jgi:hypothetical protein
MLLPIWLSLAVAAAAEALLMEAVLVEAGRVGL